MIFVQDYGNQSLFIILFLSIIAACLLGASIMDLKTCTVYNYIWWVMGAAGIVRLLVRRVFLESQQIKDVPIERLYIESMGGENVWISLFIFILLQELFFCRMYGRADCHGFAACALVGATWGMGLKEHLLHMLIAFGLLGVVQLMKGNVGRNGNLKKPVPFIPYLTVAFWVNLGAYLCV